MREFVVYAPLSSSFSCLFAFTVESKLKMKVKQFHPHLSHLLPHPEEEKKLTLMNHFYCIKLVYLNISEFLLLEITFSLTHSLSLLIFFSSSSWSFLFFFNLMLQLKVICPLSSESQPMIISLIPILSN